MERQDKKIIAYLLEYPLDLPGGAQMSTRSLCESLLGSDYEPVVICPHLLSKKPSDYPFRIITYPMGEGRLSNFIKRARAFHEIIASLSPCIVHAQMPESLLSFLFSFTRSEKRGGPVLIFTDRGLFYGYRAHTRLLMKLALRRARLLLTTTEYNRRLWREGSGIKDIRTVANTISESFSEYDDEKRERLYRERGGALTIGMAGRICEEKNWPFAARLIGMMAQRGIDFYVKLVLSVFEKGDDDKVRELSEQIISAVGEDHFELQRDLSQDEMQEYYYGVDIFIMTSRFESFGKAAVEAMSRKCAVISTDVGGLSEVIGRKENLYTEAEPERAVDYVERMSKDPGILRADQEFFYDRYLKCFSGSKCAESHIRIYDEVSLGKG